MLIRILQMLTKEELKELCKARDEGSTEARNRIVEDSINLAYKFANDHRFLPLQYLDIVQEASIGLIEAADRYDPELGAFSTYAYHWMKQKVFRAADDTGRSIRLPVNRAMQMRRQQKAAESLYKNSGEESFAEASRNAYLSDKASDIAYRNINTSVVSLEDLTEEELERLTYCDSDSPVEDEICRKIQKDVVRKLLDCLTDKNEREFTILKFGLEWGYEMTYEEIGELYDKSTVRIRQIVCKALRRMETRIFYRDKKLKKEVYECYFD